MKYSVLLMYPPHLWPRNDDPETYYEFTEAGDMPTALHEVQVKASEANHGDIDPDEFIVLFVLRGHHECEFHPNG